MEEKTQVEVIPKKRAALEIYRIHKRVFSLAILAICATMITAIMTAFNNIVGSVIAAIFTMAIAYFAVKSRRNMIYLNAKYKLGFTPPKVQSPQFK